MINLEELVAEAKMQDGLWRERGEISSALQWQNIATAANALIRLKAKHAAEDAAGPEHRRAYA